MKARLFILAATMVLSPIALAAEPDQALLAHGQAVYEHVCAACHTFAPPPRNAPPIIAISAQYHRAFSNADQAVAYMVSYVQHPTESKSILARTGMMRGPLMPPIALPEQDLQAVAAWIWSAEGTSGPGYRPMSGPGGPMMGGRMGGGY